ncbi:MAG: 4'-phosphopantetheinyl transferase superfamily protein [Acidobacteria bacterium]|nr:4'-phosphopantetheinyl transferase superfamily protein [Acidobacteriota bacterium]
MSVRNLPADEIHLWLVDYDTIGDERLLAAYRELLNGEERAQEPRFYFARDRRRYLVTRALVRTVLARYLAIDPKACTFSPNAYGRPDIVNAEANGLKFNISHTHSLIALSVARGREVGVDVENVVAREAPLDVAGHYFAPAEVAVLNAAPKHEQQHRFFEYWTFKESYIKARGMGLSLPLDKFAFHYPDDRSVGIAIDPALGDDPARWELWQYRAQPDYLVALCAERLGSRPTVIARKAVPLLSEEIVNLECPRASRNDPQQHISALTDQLAICHS